MKTNQEQQNIPERWKNKKLGEVLKIGSGKDYKHLGIGDIPVFGTGGYMSSVDKELYDGETVFIGRKGTIDKPFYFQGKFWTVDTLFYTYGFSGTSAKYVNYVFQKINWLIHNEASGVPSLSKSTIEKIKFTFPPTTEQSHIVSILNTWDQAIEKLKRKIEVKKEIKKGLMQELLAGKTRLSGFKDEWRIFKFKDVVFDIWDYRGKTPLKLGMKWGGSISALSANNVKRGYIDFDSECHMASEELYKKWMNKGDLKKGDIVFTMEAPLGNVAMITDNKKYLLSQRVVSFRISKEFSSIFVYHYMLSDAFQDRLKMLATGSTAKGVNQKALSKVTFFAPTIDEQLAVSNLLTTADQEIKKLEQKLKIFQKQKKYLLNNLITGTIRTPESLSIFK